MGLLRTSGHLVFRPIQALPIALTGQLSWAPSLGDSTFDFPQAIVGLGGEGRLAGRTGQEHRSTVHICAHGGVRLRHGLLVLGHL